MVQKTAPTAESKEISSADIRHMCGDIEDWKGAAIGALEPERGDVEMAVAWVDHRDETSQQQSLEGAAAQIFDILTADEEEEDRR